MTTVSQEGRTDEDLEPDDEGRRGQRPLRPSGLTIRTVPGVNDGAVYLK